MTGTVTKFFDQKGFGFIGDPDGDGDLFVHFSDISGNGFRTLDPGDEVEFEVADNNGKGRRAINVRRSLRKVREAAAQ